MMDGFLSVGLLQPQVCMTVCVSESLLQSDMSADLDWKIPTSSQEPAPLLLILLFPHLLLLHFAFFP